MFEGMVLSIKLIKSLYLHRYIDALLYILYIAYRLIILTVFSKSDMELEGIYTDLSTTASLCKPPVLLCSFKYEMTPPQRVKF